MIIENYEISELNNGNYMITWETVSKCNITNIKSKFDVYIKIKISIYIKIMNYIWNLIVFQIHLLKYF
jgi:hypothetical protein